jgi:hypothetical protein
MIKRTFIFLGYSIELWDFGYKSYLYPSFNTNAEFACNNEGFRQLSHYLRTISFLNQIN